MPDSLLPNFGLLKSPSNWFLVAFSMIILIFVFHLVFKEKVNG